MLIERKAGAHDKVCGEFISSEAALYLRDLGIDLAALGAVRISTVKLYTRDEVATARFRFRPSAFRAASSMRRSSASGVGLRGLRRGSASGRLSVRARMDRQLEDGHEEMAPDAFLATGKHDLRGWRRPPGRQDDLVAFKMHWRLAAAEEAAPVRSTVDLLVFPGGYAGLELVEDGIANLCLVIRRRIIWPMRAEMGSAMVTAHCAPNCLRSTKGAAGAPGRAMSGRSPSPPFPTAMSLRQTQGHGPRPLGDQAAVIPSFAGDGISIALHSARLASPILSRREADAPVPVAARARRLRPGPLGNAPLPGCSCTRVVR